MTRDRCNVIDLCASCENHGLFSAIRLPGAPLLSLLSLVAVHIALLVDATMPEKFHFDEVHDVPGARQIFEPVISSPVLNPMHAPLP
jgi:hypothetical protein